MTDRDSLKAALVKALHTHLCYTSLVADEPAFRDVLWPLFLREYAALAQPEPGLDVERLAKAIWNTISSAPHAEHLPGDCDTCDTHRQIVREVVNNDAEAIAAEYARLGAEQEADHD